MNFLHSRHCPYTLYRLNLSSSNIVARCRTLQEAGVFTAKLTRLFQDYVQELQTEINQELLETMHETGLAYWGRFGKVGQAREKELRDPDKKVGPNADIFILYFSLGLN